MSYAFFKIRMDDDGSEAERLNQFLGTHRIVGVREEWLSADDNSAWVFSVQYREAGRNGSKTGSTPRSASRNRIDYSEELSPEDFAVYSRLRDTRKAIAEEESLPVFAICNNEQLAEIAKRRCSAIDELTQIDGIGDGKATRFGERLLGALSSS